MVIASLTKNMQRLKPPQVVMDSPVGTTAIGIIRTGGGGGGGTGTTGTTGITGLGIGMGICMGIGIGAP